MVSAESSGLAWLGWWHGGMAAGLAVGERAYPRVSIYIFFFVRICSG